MGSEQVSEQKKMIPAKRVLAINKLGAIEGKLNDTIKLMQEQDADSKDLEKLVGERNKVESIKKKYIRKWDVKSHTERK